MPLIAAREIVPVEQNPAVMAGLRGCGACGDLEAVGDCIAWDVDGNCTDYAMSTDPPTMQGPEPPPGSLTTPGGTVVPGGSVNIFVPATPASNQPAQPAWWQSILGAFTQAGAGAIKTSTLPQGYYQRNADGSTTYVQPAGSTATILPPGTSAVGGVSTSPLLGGTSGTSLILIAVVALFGFMLVKGNR